jgi:Novel STAND NTPase 1
VIDERSDSSPFIGPRPYSSSERAMFFGRDEEVSRLVSLVIAHPAVLLFAVSGAGKTSLLSAGAMPALAEQGFEVLPRLRVRASGELPPDAQNAYMFSALLGLTRDGGNPETQPQGAVTLAERLATEPRGTDRYGFPSPRLLVFDQFEELFTTHPDRWHDRADFFRQVSVALAAEPSLRVLFALREEYLAQLDRYAELMPDGLRTRLHLERLRRDAALLAVSEPLRRVGVSMAAGVAETLVGDLEQARVDLGDGRTATIPGEFVEPVHLQVVCRTLWSRLGGDVREVTNADLAVLGTVDQSLTNYYDEAIAAAAARSSAREHAVRSAFERAFITSAGTRAAVFGGGQQSRDLPTGSLEALSDRHLIRGEWRAGGRWLELAHDRLIEPIQRSNRRVRSRVRRRRLRLWLVAAITGAALLGGAAALLLRSGPAPPNFQALLAAYPGDNATKEATARWMANAAKAQNLPPELPVMAALVESGLKNVNYGDADRLGFFQMRKRVWDQGPFAGFADHPTLQLLWFISQATTIRTQKLALGLADPAKTPSRYGAWIADVERPAEQFRGRYQLRYDEARGLLGLDAASGKGTGTAAPAGPTP